MAKIQVDQGKPKLGAGHLAAMGRMGLKELGSAFVMDGSNIAQPGGELGTFAQPTQGMIAKGIERPDKPAPTQEMQDHDMDRE